MARRLKRTGHTDPNPGGMEDTSEAAPPLPTSKPAKAKRRSSKRLGPRWNPMSNVYGDSLVPDFPPKID